MKIRKSSRITAIVLALMMIVPLISVPAFAADPVVHFSQNFDEATALEDVISTSNTTMTIEAEEGRGNVVKFDLTNGPSGAGVMKLTQGKDKWPVYTVAEYTQNSDGTYNGYFKYQVADNNFVDVYFENETVQTQTLTTTNVNPAKLFTKTEEEVETDEYDSTGAPIVEIVVTKTDWTEKTLYLVFENALNACQGGGNIANNALVKHDAIESTKVTYSMDYYFSSDWSWPGEIKGGKGGFKFIKVENSGKNIVIKKHDDCANISGASVSVMDNTWFNLSIVADYSTCEYSVYVNGNFAFTASHAAYGTKTAVPEDSYHFIQTNRNGKITDFKGYMMADNLTIYEGEVIPTASNIPVDRGSENFNAGFGSLTTIASNASASITSDAKYGKSESDKALLVNVDTNGEKVDSANPIIDKGASFGHVAMSYKSSTLAVLQEDIYLPADTIVQLQSQIQPIKSNGSSVNFPSLWVISAKMVGEENVATLGNEGTHLNQTTYATVLPRDKWFTLSTVIELESGTVRMYVDGKQYNEFTLTKGGAALFNLEFDASKALMVKVNKISNNASTYTTGFKGEVLFDNLLLSDTTDVIPNYEGIKKEEINLDFNYDFENAEIGKEVEAENKPSSAKYVDLNGNKVVQIDMRVEGDTPDTLASWTGTNTDHMFKLATPKFVYSDDPEAVTTLVYSADYFVNTDAAGKMESQFHSSKYFSLYEFNFNSSTINAGYGNVRFEKGVWNTVKMVVTLTVDATHIDIYLNGVWIGEYNYGANIISQNAWSVAKVMKRTEADQAGSFYVDNVKSEVYNADYAKALDATLVTTATVGGTEVKLPNNSGKFYTDKEVVLGAALDINLADYAAIIETVKQSSMRIDTAEDGKSGLRFATEIDTDLLAALEAAVGTAGAVGYGHLIAPTDLLDGITLEHGCINPLLDVKNVAHKFYNLDDDDTTTHFVGSIVDIKVANYNREFTAVGYVSITLTNGTVLYIYSATTHATSVKAQAEATIGSYAEGSAEWNILNGFINPTPAA